MNQHVDASAGECAGPSSRSAVTAGVRWGLIDQIVQVVLRFGTTIVLARLLAPRDFGLFGVVLIVVNLAAVLSGLGLGPALIQRKELRPAHVYTAFTASAAFGVLLTLLVAAAGVPIGAYFHEARLPALLAVIAGTFVLRGLELIPNDLLIREMRFRSYYLSSTVATGIASVVGIAAGWAGIGVWALVAMTVTESFLATSLGWTFAISEGVWKPRFGFDRSALSDLSGFGSLLTAERFVGFGQGNADNIVVGRILGAGALGYYSLAYRVILLPLQRFGEVVGASAFPSLSSVQNDLKRLRSGYLEATQLVAAACFPLTAGIAVTAPVAVPNVLGSRWNPAVPTIQVLAIGGAVLAINRLSGVLARSVGKVSWTLWASSIELVVYVPAFVIGARFGIRGVALGFSIATVLTVVPELRIVTMVLHLRWTAVVGAVLPVMAATAVMATAASVAQAVLRHAPPFLSLTATTTVGVAAYVLMLRWLAPRIWGRGLQMIRRRDA